MRPRVSVVIAVRNGAETLAEAIASVHAQGELVHEVIVVDDGSSDASATVAADAGATVLRNTGARHAGALNLGTEHARGTHLAFNAHDDLWLPGKLERQLAAIAAGEGELAAGRITYELLGDPPSGFRRELLVGSHVGRITETLLAPREVFARVGSFDPATSPDHDTDWFARAGDLGLRVAVPDEPVLRKRVTPTSAHHSPSHDPGLLLALRHSIERKRQRTS